MKKILVALTFLFAFCIGFVCSAHANTWQPKVEQYPHGGPNTAQFQADNFSPGNATVAASKANPYNYFNTYEQPSSQQCIPQSTWTFYTWDLIPPRPPLFIGPYTGHMHYWRQDC